MKKIYILFFLLSMFAFGKNLHAQTVTCDSVLQTSTCAGGNIIIPFSVSSNFNFGNVFTAQLSDMWGSFANPVNIGSIPWFTNGIIFGTIPANTNFGFLYRIRIIASSPNDTSNASPNTIIITQIAQLNDIVSNPGDSACPGDTITLTALNPGAAYAWSTGDTTQSIQVTQAGVYSVTTTDILNCQSTTSDTIYFDPSFCTGIEETSFAGKLDFFPNPASEFIRIQYTESRSIQANLSIYSSHGSLIRSERIFLQAGQALDVSLTGLATGLYQFVLESDGERAAKRIIVR
ncbi:MAG: T9SS type A sorting domain-containing protein [Bacteroidia bacterium]